MYNILHDPHLVQQFYQKNYMDLIKYYQNVARTGIYIKYYNISNDISHFDFDTNATVDIYASSDVHFNLYDLTPSFFVQSVNNRSTMVQDLDGDRMDGMSSIVVYTIQQPQIHDLVAFYPPITSGEIFRVSNVTTPISGLHSETNLTWYELELEYAPIKSVERIKQNNHFVYDVSDEKYLAYDTYAAKLEKLTRCETYLSNLNECYDEYRDLYMCDRLVSPQINEIIKYFKQSFNDEYRRLFERFKSPYGYIDMCGLHYDDPTTIPLNDITLSVYNIDTRVYEDYTRTTFEEPFATQMDKMLYWAQQLYSEVV